jgi:hypothetical protein
MKVAIVANLRVGKSRLYGNCLTLTGILDIFKLHRNVLEKQHITLA